MMGSCEMMVYIQNCVLSPLRMSGTLIVELGANLQDCPKSS